MEGESLNLWAAREVPVFNKNALLVTQIFLFLFFFLKKEIVIKTIPQPRESYPPGKYKSWLLKTNLKLMK